MWYRMMAVAFVTNGLGVFGSRVFGGLPGGLGRTHSFLYLLFWYGSAFVLASILFFSRNRNMLLREVLLGGLMGLCSSAGWIFLTQALAKGIQGYLAFPIAIGGSLSIVTAVGVLVFKEKVSRYGYAGILAGVAGVVLLSTV